MDRKRKIKFIGISLLYIFLLLLALNGYLRKNKLDKQHKYTTCYVNELYVMGRGGIKIYYKFSVNDKIYKSSYICSSLGYKTLKLKVLHKTFLVKFQTDNPDNCRIMLKYRVKEGLKAPPEGWDKIP